MKEWTFEASIDSIPAITEAIDAELEALGCPMRAQMQIDVAIDELVSNVANYAYGDKKGSVTVRFEFVHMARLVRITFIDTGTPYNPLEKEDPDTTLSAEQRGIGGLGIFLVKKTMDALIYAHEQGRNIVTIEKKL